MTKTARFLDMKQRGQKIAVLTGYDAPTAKAEAEAGVDIILVGDSVGGNDAWLCKRTGGYSRRHVSPCRRRSPRRAANSDHRRSAVSHL